MTRYGIEDASDEEFFDAVSDLPSFESHNSHLAHLVETEANKRNHRRSNPYDENKSVYQQKKDFINFLYNRKLKQGTQKMNYTENPKNRCYSSEVDNFNVLNPSFKCIEHSIYDTSTSNNVENQNLKEKYSMLHKIVNLHDEIGTSLREMSTIKKEFDEMSEDLGLAKPYQTTQDMTNSLQIDDCTLADRDDNPTFYWYQIFN